MARVDVDIPAAEWCAERRVRLNEWIIMEILRLSERELRRVRANGFVFAKVDDVINDRMNADTVRIVFGEWGDFESVDSVDGRCWLMAFDFAVEYFGAPYMLHLDDPSMHPWNAEFDSAPRDRIRAMLIQFLLQHDPVSILEQDRRFL